MANGEIKKFREKHHLSVEDLASKLGVSHMTIRRWEKGIKRPQRILWGRLKKIMQGYAAKKVFHKACRKAQKKGIEAVR